MEWDYTGRKRKGGQKKKIGKAKKKRKKVVLLPHAGLKALPI